MQKIQQAKAAARASAPLSARSMIVATSLLALALALGASPAEAAWWKDYAFVNNGDTHHYLDLYSNWAGADENTDWTETSMTFESTWPLYNVYTCHLSSDFTVKNLETNNGHNNIDATFDLAPYTLTTANANHGLYIKGQSNLVTLASGELSITGKVSIGCENGSYDTLRILTNATLHARSMGIGGGTAWSADSSVGNTLDVNGGLVLFETGWGYTLGEQPLGDNGGTMLVRNGGIVSNLVNSAFVGYKSSNNLLDIRDGGFYHMSRFQHLGKVDGVWSAPTTNNMIRVENGGVAEFGNALYVGDNADPDYANSHNVLWVGDGGTVRCGGDVYIRGSGNRVVISNGVFSCNSFRSIDIDNSFQYRDQASDTELVLAGRAPSMSVLFYFVLRRQAKVHFSVPAEGYSTTPVTVRLGCEVEEDTELTVDARAYQRAGGGSLQLIDADMNGSKANKVYVPDDDGEFSKLNALVARWNASMPDGCSVRLSDDRCSLWLDVKEMNGTMILLR